MMSTATNLGKRATHRSTAEIAHPGLRGRVRPLSEDDQRKLDQIEQALSKDDSRFAETVNIDRWRRRRIVLAGTAFTIGDRGPARGVLVITQAVLVLGLIISIAGALTISNGSSSRRLTPLPGRTGWHPLHMDHAAGHRSVGRCGRARFEESRPPS